ncbi:MAG: carbohydrate ABC transporter permease, partial [Treponema sp.]|nr:carbohydrate ABC transporter permease [Treponema sp.]
MRRNSPAAITLSVLNYGFMIFIGFTMLVPLFWMISTSLKIPTQIAAYPPIWIPRPLAWGNYPTAFKAAPFVLFFYNTFKVSILETFGTLIISSLAAFSFARLRFRGKEAAFLVLLTTMMIPYTVRVIPLYAMFKMFGWIDTHTALIVPPILSNVFGVFLLRQFFMSLPMDLDEAARIDGASSFTIYSRIIIPLSKPALATLGLFTFRTAWNQFLPALVYINSQKKYLITVGLTMFQGEHETAWNLMMAGAVISIIPIIVLFASAQKYFIR